MTSLISARHSIESSFGIMSPVQRRSISSGEYDNIIGLKPRRVIFNPGAENSELAQKLKDAGIEVVEACTLVMLRTEQY